MVNKSRFFILSTLFMYVLATIAAIGCNNARAAVPELEQREQALNRSIMCPVCPGESIDQSQVALAVQMRGIVREKLSAGWTDDEVREFFVERYGPSVLLAPPTDGVSLAVWLVPPIGVVAAVGVFVLALRHMRRRPTVAYDGEDDDDGRIKDEDLQRYYQRIEKSVSDDS